MMDSAQLARRYALLRRVQYTPQTPTLKQATFLALDCREAFFGGAAGPGKSSALLMAALQFVDVPGYSALILRRTYADLSLPGAIMSRAHEWLAGTDARWNGSTKTYTFPSGATLTFGYLQNGGDHLRYQGAEFTFVGFDELTQFPRYQYTYLFSRLRRLKGVDVPIRMRSASNPGGPGHEWVRKRFILNGRRKGRVFIPARMGENPYLDQQEYNESLSKLDPVTCKQLRDGDWHVAKSGLVYPDMASLCTVEPSDVPRDLEKRGVPYGGIDWGFNNPFAAVHGFLDKDDVLWLTWCRYKRGRTVPQHEEKLRTRPRETMWFADPSRPEDIHLLRLKDHVVRAAPNAVDSGIDLVSERIYTSRMKIVSTLHPVLSEAGLYTRGDDTGDSDEDDDDDLEVEAQEATVEDGEEPNDRVDPGVGAYQETPNKAFDHAMDAVRYTVAGIAKINGIDGPGLVPETPDSEKEIDEDELREWRRWDNPSFW